MNPLLNPINSFSLIKNSLVDPGRLKRLSPQQLKHYRDKTLRKIITYASTIPLYHTIYKKAGIHPRDIKTIDDIEKLPFISKNDLRQHFPDRLLPEGAKKNKFYVISTGGTTGKSVYIYTDFLTMGKASGPFIRELRTFDLNWRKARMAHIGNFNPCRIDLVAQEHFYKHLNTFISLDNTLNIDVSTPTKEIITALDSFHPDVILSYPAIYQHIAFLKRKGQGKNITPTILLSAGSILDEYTRRYVEDAFKCRLLNTYQSVEAHGTIASECQQGTWHVHSDFYHVEAIDKQGNPVAPGERGHLVITRLFGRGTPIIRYTGMDDWVRILPNTECHCGLNTPVIEGGVQGRMRANIVLPDGKVFPPGAFCFIEPVLNKHKTFKIRQYQIIQHTINEIDILLVIDEDLRTIGPPLKTIIQDIKTIYQNKTGPNVTITVKEVPEIKHPKDARKPPPIVISHVTPEEGYKVFEK